MLLAVACGGGEGGGGGDAAAPVRPSTTAPPMAVAAPGACGLKPMTFVNERWQGSGAAPPSGTGVLWEQTFTFSNPNTVDVRLLTQAVHLRLSGSGGYFLKFARTTFRLAPDDLVLAGRDQQRVAQVWLAEGNTPATEDVFATTSARVAGADCPVPVERLSAGAVPAHVLALPSCDPKDAGSPC
ncbi:MAG: hypothetical protein ACR2KK_16610 [Acidimicrobiales bacterium]